MRRAQQRDASQQQKFYFRRSIYPDDVIPHDHSHNTPSESAAHTPVTGPSPPDSPNHHTNPFSTNSDVTPIINDDGLPAPHPEQHPESSYTGSSGTHESVRTPSTDRINTAANRDPPLSVPQSRCLSPAVPALGAIEDEYEEMTITEIINGKGESFPGLLGVVNAYLNTLNVEFAAKKRMRTYLNLIKWRADGSCCCVLDFYCAY